MQHILSVLCRHTGKVDQEPGTRDLGPFTWDSGPIDRTRDL